MRAVWYRSPTAEAGEPGRCGSVAAYQRTRAIVTAVNVVPHSKATCGAVITICVQLMVPAKSLVPLHVRGPLPDRSSVSVTSPTTSVVDAIDEGSRRVPAKRPWYGPDVRNVD